MSEYLVYGKRTEAITDKYTGKVTAPDKNFAALDGQGQRVTRLADAMSFATKEDAQEWLYSKNTKPGTVFEIRKAK